MHFAKNPAKQICGKAPEICSTAGSLIDDKYGGEGEADYRDADNLMNVIWRDTLTVLIDYVQHA